MTVLIINDEVFTAQMIQEEVNWESCGITKTLLAYTAKEAREALGHTAIDILLCDIEMPGENGIELMRWVRESGLSCECIFLTCHADFNYAQEAIRLDCQDYILMPARAEEIEEGLRKVVRRIRQRRESGQLERYGEQWILSKREKLEQQEGKKSAEQIAREARDFILQNLGNEELSVSMVAEKCNLSPEHLNRIFRKEEGYSLGQYMIKERMELAGRLLREGKVSATVVAQEVGYPNYSYFSASFKKYYGCSPQRFIQGEEP